MLSISIGKDSYTSGWGCIAIGDGTKSIGMWQVNTNPAITLPDDMTCEHIGNIIKAMESICEVYDACVRQGHAPPEFGAKAREAIVNTVIYLNNISKEIYEKSKLPNAEVSEETVSVVNTTFEVPQEYVTNDTMNVIVETNSDTLVETLVETSVDASFVPQSNYTLDY